MRSTRTKVLILVGLLAVWALIFTLRRPSQPPVGSQPSPAAARTPGAGAGPPRLRADLLSVPRAPYPSEVQNIFGSPPPPAPPPAVRGVGGPGASPASPAPPPPDPFQEEARQLRYVGFLQAGDAATAFLVRGQEVHTVAVGGLVGGRFRVVEVRDDSVLLASPDGGKEIRLSLAADAGVPPRAPGAPR